MPGRADRRADREPAADRLDRQISTEIFRRQQSSHPTPHLEVVIRLRARRDRRRAARYEHVSIDSFEPDDASSEIADVEASLAVSTSARTIESDKSAEAAMTETMTQLRALAVDDPLAQRFLDATDHEATTRAQIMRLAGLTRTEYHNTRRRLARLVAQLQTRRAPSAKED